MVTTFQFWLPYYHLPIFKNFLRKYEKTFSLTKVFIVQMEDKPSKLNTHLLFLNTH